MSNLSVYRSKVYFLRNQNVMLDEDLAAFYGTEIRVFNQARKRHEDELKLNTFQLTRSEWEEIQTARGSVIEKRTPPWAYTEDAVFSMAFFLKSDTARKVAKLIIETFISVRNGSLVPAMPDNQTKMLSTRIGEVDRELSGATTVITNNYFAPVTNIQGNHNQVGVSDDLVVKLNKLRALPNLSPEVQSLMIKSMDQVEKKDKEGLLSTLSKVLDLTGKLGPISQALPGIIETVKNYFT